MFLIGCSAKKKTVAPATLLPLVRSQKPPPTAEVIEHGVVTKRETAWCSCRCVPVTAIDPLKTGHTVIVCKSMPRPGDCLRFALGHAWGPAYHAHVLRHRNANSTSSTAAPYPQLVEDRNR